MRCARVRKSLTAYLDSELPADLCQEMATHLQCCTSCRQSWTRLRQLDGLMRVAPAVALPDGFSERVLSQARQRDANPRPAERAAFALIGRWKSVSLMQRTAAAAVLVTGIATGLLMGWQTGSKQSAQARANSAAFDDPVVVFNLDYLSSDPDGSLPRAYLSLVSAQKGPGE